MNVDVVLELATVPFITNRFPARSEVPRLFLFVEAMGFCQEHYALRYGIRGLLHARERRAILGWSVSQCASTPSSRRMLTPIQELDEIVSVQCQEHELIDNALRSYLAFTANYKGRL